MKPRLSILYASESIVAIDKPSGLLSVPDRYHEDKPSLARMVLTTYPNARPLHRLDFETSGVLLFCILPDAFGWYSDQFEQRQVMKKYLVICDGRLMQERGIIDAPLFTQSTGKVIVTKRGKSSQTEWSLRKVYRHHSLIEAHPLTGRTHQIRVHLSSIGHPVTGDLVYGSQGPLLLSQLKGKHRYKPDTSLEEERPLISRIALHASGMGIREYLSGVQLLLESPLPKDMRVAIAKLNQYATISG